MQPFMFAEDLSLPIHDRSGFVWHECAKKITHFDLPDKANSLAIFFQGGCQIEFTCKPPNLGLLQFPDRKSGGGDLVLGQEGEKIGLVLVFIYSLKDVPRTVLALDPARVVTRRD